jgi:hypothetical protein
MIISPTNVKVNRDGEITAVTFASEDGVVTITKRRQPDWRSSRHDRTEFQSRPRMYVSGDVEETVLDHLNNRTNRPMKIWRKGAMNLISQWALPFSKFELKWSQNAGCRMCPCSPGFIMQMDGYSKHDSWSPLLAFDLPDGRSVRFSRFDVWVHLNNTSNVDETRPSRNVTVLV